MHPSGAHTHPEHGGGAGGAAVAVLALMIIAAFARPLLHVIGGLEHTLAELLRVLLVAAAVIAGTGLAAGTGFVAWKLRRTRRRAARYTATVLHPRRRAAPPVSGHPHPALGARPAEVHLHLHGLTPEQAAEAIARHAQQARWPGLEGED
jgi:hypothetical protein